MRSYTQSDNKMNKHLVPPDDATFLDVTTMDSKLTAIIPSPDPWGSRPGHHSA